jgi:hypothetical protein
MQASYSPFQNPRSFSEVIPVRHYRFSCGLIISFGFNFVATAHEYICFLS